MVCRLQYHVLYVSVLCRAAYKCWCEAIDALLGIENAVNEWSSVLKNSVDVSAELLKRCGLWGCLLVAVISSNIAQYVHPPYYLSTVSYNVIQTIV